MVVLIGYEEAKAELGVTATAVISLSENNVASFTFVVKTLKGINKVCSS